jgi:putative transposase
MAAIRAVEGHLIERVNGRFGPEAAIMLIAVKVRFVPHSGRLWSFGFQTCARHDSSGQEDLPMSDNYWLSEIQIERIKPYFPRSHGRPRVDDRRVISGIIHVIRNGLRWRDAPEIYGPHKTLYNRFVRWSRMGVFDRIFSGLTIGGGEPDIVMIDATHLKVHRTAASLHKKGLFQAV